MPFPFMAILIAGATGLFLTAILFLLVRRMPRTEPGAGWWAVSSLAAGLGYVMLLILANQGRPAAGEAVYNILFVAWSMALYIGGRRFLEHTAFETPVFLLSGATGLWLIFFYFVSPAFLPAAIGVSVFCGALNLHLGWIWARHTDRLSAIHYLLIGSLWVSGLHWLDYPFLRPVEWFAPIGFTLCSVISVIVNGTLAGLLLNQFRTRMEEAEQAAVVAARSDALTGLSNRFALDMQFERAVANATRHGNRLAMLFLDLDRFKIINDTHGHKVGDLVLMATAERLRSTFRDTDIVARIGGDEFVVILADMESNDTSGTETTVRKLLDAIGEPIHLEGIEYQVTASIGVSFFPDHGATLNHMMLAADKAMYAAKLEGKNAYSLAP